MPEEDRMVLTIRKVNDKYCLVEKKTGKVRKSFETKGAALSYKIDEEDKTPKRLDYYKLTKTIKEKRQ